jgi:hypothetical protein
MSHAISQHPWLSIGILRRLGERQAVSSCSENSDHFPEYARFSEFLQDEG